MSEQAKKPLEILIEEESKEIYGIINKYALSPGITVLLVKEILHNCLMAEARINNRFRITEALLTEAPTPTIPIDQSQAQPEQSNVGTDAVVM
jgi:hypothetical protein